jgi:hypothetical protein
VPPDDVSRMRHAIRGCLNAMRLSAFALDKSMAAEDAAEFLGYLESSAEKLLVLIEQWDELPEIAATAR